MQAKSKKSGASSTAKPQSFAEKRALDRQQALQKANTYRKQLIKKEYSSPEPLKSGYHEKGKRVDVQIRKLKKLP